MNKAGHSEALTTSGLWAHEWQPVIFALVVDHFNVECVGEKHAHHLIQTLQTHYDVAEDWSSNKFLGIDLEWNHIKRTLRLSMNNYITTVL